MPMVRGASPGIIDWMNLPIIGRLNFCTTVRHVATGIAAPLVILEALP
jgi:hypothetical protein